MKYNVNETCITKITSVLEVLILTIYLNIIWDDKNRASPIGVAGTAMAALVFVVEKCQLLEFIIMTM